MRSFLGSIAVIATFLIGTPAHGAWQAAGLQGSNVLSLAEDPTVGSTWFAGTASGAIYKYTEATGWLAASTGLPSGHGVLALRIDPASPAVVYAALDGAGVYRSTDGGNTWSPAGLDALSVRSIEVDPYDSSILYAAANGQIYRSVNAASSWEAVTATVLASANVQKVTFNPPDLTQTPPPARTDTIYAAALGGLYRSADRGSSWVMLDTAASGVSSVNFTTVAVDLKDPAVVYAGTADAGICKSADGGNTWAAMSDGLGAIDVVAIAFYPQASSSLLVGTAADGIYRSDSSGRSWYAWNDGNDATRANAVAFLAPQGTVIFAGTNDGVFSFDNSGADLVVTAVSGTTAVSSDTDTSPQITVTATVKNVGAGSTSSWFYTCAYLSSDAAITTEDTPIGCQYNWGALAPGGETSFEIPSAIPRALGAGTYYIGVIADVWSQVAESNESNNAAAGNQLTMTRTPVSPDLVVTAVSGTTAVSSDTDTSPPITVTATVKNVGDGSTWSWFYTCAYLSSDAAITTEDTPIGCQYNWGALAPGGETSFEIPSAIPRAVGAGTYYIGVIADVWSQVAESNESNNAAAGNQLTMTRTQPTTLTANAGPDQVLECPATQEVSLTLDGTGSSSPGGAPLTYAWTWTDGANTYNATGAAPAVTFPRWGTYAVGLQVTDTSGLTSPDTVNITVGDTIAPRTTASVVGTRNENGVYTSAVTVTLTSRDACTGVKEIHYTIDDAEHVVTFTPVAVASTLFTVSDSGTHAITFWSVDNAGRVSSSGSTQINAEITTPPPGGGS